jgi:hypothetical protein
MAWYDDILDLLGRTPRELGCVQLHAGPVARDGSGRAVATLWLQAAFEPLPPGTIALAAAAADGGPAAAPTPNRIALPPLAGGRVVRLRVPVSVGADAARLRFEVDCPVGADARRVRAPWKLLDTIEMVKTEEAPSDGLNVLAANVALNAALLPLGYVGMTNIGIGSGGGGSTIRTVTHAARTQAPFVEVDVVEGEAGALSAPEAEEVWRPGQPVPEPAPLQAIAPAPPPASKAPAERRSCLACGYREDAPGADSARYCPACGAAWD